MKRFLQIFIWLLLSFVIVGLISLFAKAICDGVVKQHGSIIRDPASGHVVPFDIRLYRGGPHETLYVTRTYDLTSTVLGYMAAIGIGFPVFAALIAMTVNLIRLLLPGSFVPANFELARYRAAVGGNGVTDEGLRYVAAWRDLKRRTLSAFCLIVGGMTMPVGAILALGALSLGSALSSPVFGAMVLGFFGVGTGGGIVLMFYMRAFRCPRCHEPFAKRAGRRPLNFCTQCGLPKNSPPTTEVSPDFVKWKEEKNS